MTLVARRLSAASILFALTACSNMSGQIGDTTGTGATGTSSSSGSSSGAPQSANAKIRVVHASPDAPAVDVYPKGSATPVIQGLSYGSASPYLELPPGTYDLELRASPSTASDPVAYSTGSLTLAAGDQVTTIAAGLLASNEDSSKFRVLSLPEHFGNAGSGNAIVRVVHAGSDAPSVSLDLDNDNPSSPDVTGLDRFMDSGDWGLPITAGKARQIGIVAGGKTVTAFTTPALPEGAQLFVIATGLLAKAPHDKDGFDLLAIGPMGAIGFIRQNPFVHALHAGPDAPSVDAFVGDAEVVDGISFGELSGELQVPPGDYALDFFAHADGNARPSGSPAATANTGKLEAGERYLTIATGFLGSNDPTSKFRLTSVSDQLATPPANQAELRVVHACPDAPAVDIGVLNAEKKVSPVIISDLTFGTASDAAGFALATGTTPIGVAATGQTDPVASFHVGVTAGLRGFAIAAGSLASPTAQSFRLLVVDTTSWTVGTVQPQPKQ